ncbi:MAG: hypothetical protein ACFE7S_07995 [Candidatus Hodarchaeota archaeon]
MDEANSIAQRYMRITGLGCCKPPPDLTCDEAKAHKGIAVKHSHKLLPLGRSSLQIPPLNNL